MFGCTWQVVENNMRNLTLSGHVGFDSLPDQLVNKSVSQGFCFNILCVGQCKHTCRIFLFHYAIHIMICYSQVWVWLIRCSFAFLYSQPGQKLAIFFHYLANLWHCQSSRSVQLSSFFHYSPNDHQSLSATWTWRISNDVLS